MLEGTIAKQNIPRIGWWEYSQETLLGWTKPLSPVNIFLKHLHLNIIAQNQIQMLGSSFGQQGLNKKLTTIWCFSDDWNDNNGISSILVGFNFVYIVGFYIFHSSSSTAQGGGGGGVDVVEVVTL